MRPTDKLLNELEKEIGAVYDRANFELQKKIVKDLKQYEKDMKRMQRLEKQKKITPEQFDKWKMSEILKMQGQLGLREEFVDALTKTNVIASELINGRIPLMYAEGYNYGTYSVEKLSKIDTSFSLYNQETVQELLTDDPELLPTTKVNVPKDKRWNRQHVNSEILQGVLQGESMDQIAERFKKVVGMNNNSAIRNARTATTCAENRGNMDSYRRAQGLGINVKKEWMATLDSRTRHSHRAVDGEVRGIDEEFSNGLVYPGDPNGQPEDLYNCRCTTVPWIEGFDNDQSWKYDAVDYNEWRGEHEH